MRNLFARRPPEPDPPSIGGGFIKRGILLFWALWITVVVVMNVLDELKALHVLPPDWSLSSHNYDAIVKVTSNVHGLPRWLDALLLFGVIVWETIAAVLCWRAFRLFRRNSRRRLRAAYTALTSLLALFGTFILTDELFHAFKVEGDHRGISVLLLVSLFALQFLPDEASERV